MSEDFHHVGVAGFCCVVQQGVAIWPREVDINAGRFAETGAATHSHKGGRSSKGNNELVKTGSANLVEEGDSQRKQKKVLTKAFDKAKKGEKVSIGYKLGTHEVTLAPGDKEHWGRDHAERKEHPKKFHRKSWQR